MRTQLKIDGNKIETTNSVVLLGIHIDNKLTSDDHIFTLYNKAAMQLNAIDRLKGYLGKKEYDFETLLKISGTSTMQIQRIKQLVIDI